LISGAEILFPRISAEVRYVSLGFDKQKMSDEFKKQFGFVPPCSLLAEGLGPDMQEIISQYHHIIWGEGVIPLKYRYLMALATAVYGDDDTRAKLELLKALRHGATREEVIEVFRQQVWMKGAHILVKLSPLIKFMDTISSTMHNQEQPM
jgi:alkylhydroperoxidase/carboxymuconolactone decarboxylase family protein YurZ